MLEQSAQWNLGRQGVANPRDQLGGEEGMASQFEEVVMDSDSFDAEYIAQNGRQLLRMLPGGESVKRTLSDTQNRSAHRRRRPHHGRQAHGDSSTVRAQIVSSTGQARQ